MTQSKQPLPCCSSSSAAPGAMELGNILLNNFQLKKKSYRVLLHGQQLIWERMQKIRENEKQAPPMETKVIPDGSTGCAYGPSSHVLHIDDIISVKSGDTKVASMKPPDHVPISGGSTRPTNQYLTINYAQRLSKSKTDCNRWQLQRLTLYNADPYIVRQWLEELQLRLSDSTPTRMRVRRLLVFINPYGGRKAGSQTYERDVKPVFQLAGIDATCITTQRANQIRDILLTHDLSCYDAVCCVGGDGTVAEVINGLIFRRIKELGLDERKPAFIPRPELTVGVIPAGSTDTIAYSMHGTADVRTAAIHVILGQHRGLDVCSVSNSQTLLRFCASVLSYGYLGDVAAQSEQYRWMGTRRYEYSGVKAFISNRGYEAELRLVEEVNSPLSPQTPLIDDDNVSTICYANCERCSFASSIIDQRSSIFNTEQLAQSREELPQNDVPTVEQPALHLNSSETALLRRPRPNQLQLTSSTASGGLLNSTYDLNSPEHQWKTIKGNFFMICGANITCACSRSPNGISRYSHLGDGCLDLILVKKTSLINNVRFLLNTAGRGGDIRNLPFVEVYRTRKFQFRTLSAAAASEESNFSLGGSCQPIAQAEVGGTSEYSSWNCDGEVVTDLDITMISHCQLIDVFMRGPHSYSKPLKRDNHAPMSPTTPNSSSDNVYCCCNN
ncbi:uncharacterized protein Dwil_GK14278 [Drosophila willistoni]|uniref:DAGKc domain-containing protein n=1 Tax=Drosophila willistoni TaxID=7260 RepID=B4NI54_DROWI|nr:ceramide kinase [Drosophila willistoni]EDW84746.1 uncharacterized protein Dwil_GK14278 [Drosophila willistoni]